MGFSVKSFDKCQTFLFGEERVTRWKANAFCRELGRDERKITDCALMGELFDKKKASYDSLLKNLKKFEKSNSASTKQTISSLQYNWVALQSRAGKQETGNSDLVRFLEEWKKEQPLYNDEEKRLNLIDSQQLQKLLPYPEFSALLVKDKQLRRQFFNWAIRDLAPVDVFVEYPEVALRLKKCYIASRVGRVAKETLKIEKSGKKKDLKILFETDRWYSILDEKKQVEFKSGIKTSLKKVFDVFADKNFTCGFVEFFENGIENFDTRRYGSYVSQKKFLGIFGTGRKFQKIDWQGNWWEKLPVIETLTKEQLERRLGVSVGEKQGVYMVRATTETKHLDIRKTHAYLGVAIKSGEHFKIYDFGKNPKNFPRSGLGVLWFLTNTVGADVEYNDTNNFFSQRQHAIHPIVCEENEIKKLMQTLKEEIELASKGNLVFQLSWKNCAHWADQVGLKVFEKGYQEKFKAKFSELEPSDPVLKFLIKKIDHLSKRSRIFWLTLSLLLFTWRVKWVRVKGKHQLDSVAATPFAWKQRVKPNEDIFTYTSGKLPLDILAGRVRGVVFSGNSSLRFRTGDE